MELLDTARAYAKSLVSSTFLLFSRRASSIAAAV